MLNTVVNDIDLTLVDLGKSVEKEISPKCYLA